MDKKPPILGIIVTIIILIVVCSICFCLVSVTGGLVALSGLISNESSYLNPLNDFANSSAQTLTIVTHPASQGAIDTLHTLEQVEIPINDPHELIERLGGLYDIPETFIDPLAPYQTGAVKDFWISNVDSDENFKISAVLHFVGDHIYIWIEEGINFNQDELIAIGTSFDNHIYPTTRRFFGTEWLPGVDGDPHIFLLYAGGLGNSLAGYYSSTDELHPLINSYSNAHEMFLINADNVSLSDNCFFGTIAHELQHMIHWYTDRNEKAWVNEGFSMLSELLNGYDPSGFDYEYSRNTDLQLNDWVDDNALDGPHYGASFLYMTYMLDRLGEEGTKAIVAHPENGMKSIDIVMRELGIRDPLTGIQITSENIFTDWTITNYLLDPNVSDGRYDYHIYDSAPRAKITEVINSYATNTFVRDVNQYGVDYIKFDLRGSYTLQFQGSNEVKIMPVDAFSGKYMYFSNKGDDSDMRLTREFDFTEVNTPITMSYYTWFDLEEDYDYLYVSASTDGETWQILKTPSCSDTDPSDNNFGCGYTGQSNAWIHELIDLSQYAGDTVQIRFEYITDAVLNGHGFLFDDFRIDAIGYFADFEDNDGGWFSEGWARIQNHLPQTFSLSLIINGKTTKVQHIILSENKSAEIVLNLTGDVKEAILIVSGTTLFTNQKAIYQYRLIRN